MLKEDTVNQERECFLGKTSAILAKLNNIGWFEFGFLWGIFFAPWGPVPRYLGWAISIGAWLSSKKVREETKGSLPLPFRMLLVAFVGWSFFVTGISGVSLHGFVKGASNPVEMAFSIWLAASVLRKEGAPRRCVLTLWATTVLTGSWTLFRYLAASLGIFSEYVPGPFSNINTLGGYAFPLCAFWFALSIDPDNQWKLKAVSGLIFSICMLFLSFSSLPWIATLTACVAGSILLRFEGGNLRPAVRGLAIAMAVIALLVAFPGKPIAKASLQREIAQISTVNDPKTFTNNRTAFVQGTVFLFRQKPVTGWGWGRFEDIFPIAQRELGLHSDENPLSPHNLYLGLLCESGVIGLALFVCIVLSVFSAAWKFRKGNRKGLAVAILSVILAYGGYSLGGSVFDARRDTGCLTWFLLGSVWILQNNIEPVALQAKRRDLPF